MGYSRVRYCNWSLSQYTVKENRSNPCDASSSSSDLHFLSKNSGFINFLLCHWHNVEHINDELEITCSQRSNNGIHFSSVVATGNLQHCLFFSSTLFSKNFSYFFNKLRYRQIFCKWARSIGFNVWIIFQTNERWCTALGNTQVNEKDLTTK